MKRKHDFRPLILLLVAVVMLVVAIILNNSHELTNSNKIASSIEVDNGDLKINWERYQTVDIDLQDSLTITESGTYHLTGSLTDGNITVDAGVSEIRLILDNVNITSTSGPAIYCSSAEDLVIELVGDNSLTDGIAYDSQYDEDVTGIIYTKADLTIGGEGNLTLTSNYQDAIVGKDDIKFTGGTYDIKSQDDAIRGKDSVYITNGNFTITAGADAIKSTNTTDQGKGFVLIENGNFNLTSVAKGIKATRSILISGGEYMIDTRDDSIHSDNYIGITGGNIHIVSGDDGIHANHELIIDNGTININKAYEGLEAQKITVNNGDISLTTIDDGINAGGGADSSSNNRPGANNFNVDENCIISINGGKIYVNSTGDGIDSNGWLYINGGDIIVDGPTDNGNGALDSGMGIIMNGGTALAIGAAGMAETLGNNSSVNNISVYFSDTYDAGTEIKILDSKNQTVLEHTSAKSFNHLSAGSTEFELGSTYTIYINNERYDNIVISDITTTIGNSRNNFNNNIRPR